MAAKKPTKSDCAGCRDDFYNYSDLSMGRDGSGNPVCWMLAEADFVRNVEVHVDERPPWHGRPKLRLGCFHRSRHVYVSPDDPRVAQKGRS